MVGFGSGLLNRGLRGKWKGTRDGKGQCWKGVSGDATRVRRARVGGLGTRHGCVLDM